MKEKRLLLISIIFFLFHVLGLHAFAGEPTDQIKSTTDKILAILTDPKLKPESKARERRRLIRAAVDERFDWEEMSRRALARHWNPRTPEERKEFVKLFGDLVEQTYMDKVEGYSGEKVVYEGDTVEGGYSTVKVKILTSTNKEIPVEYRLHKKNNAWLVYDLTIEGISLVNNYRSQFNSILVKSSFKDLLQKLREKSVQRSS